MMTMKQQFTRTTLSMLCLMLLSTAGYTAQFRGFAPIAKPEAAPQGYTRAQEPTSLPSGLVRKALQRLFNSWNSSELRQHLSDKFYNKSRLLDVVATEVPRDAKLRVLAVQGVQVLEQYYTTQQSPRLLQTRVSATARVQLEWNDLNQGFQRLEGTVEYMLDLTTRAGSATKGEPQ